MLNTTLRRRRRIGTGSAVALLSAASLILGAAPADATYDKVAQGYFPNGVYYYITVDVLNGFVSGTAETNAYYSEATIYIAQCSGTGDCTNYVVMASGRNYNDYYIETGNPKSFGHTYKTCFSARFGTTSYSNYCTPLHA